MVEQGKPALVVLEHELPETPEDVMHVVRRRGSGNAIDESLGHGVAPSGHISLTRKGAIRPLFYYKGDASVHPGLSFTKETRSPGVRTSRAQWGQ